MLRFPAVEVPDIYLIIGVLGTRLGNIHNDRFTNQLFDRNLIDRTAILEEVYRRVDVGSTMLGRGESVRRVVIAFLSNPGRPANQIEASFRWPIDRAPIESVSEIDNPMCPAW